MNYSEKDVQNKILNYLKKLKNEGHPIYYERRQAGGFSYKKGLPDIYFTYHGLHFEIEVKSSTGQLSTTQEIWQRIFTKNSTPYVVVNNFEKFKELVDEIIFNRQYIYELSKSLSELIKEINDE